MINMNVRSWPYLAVAEAVWSCEFEPAVTTVRPFVLG